MTATKTPRLADQPLTILEGRDAAAWDALVRASPDASFCHLWGWREVIENTMGHQALYREARDADGTLVGVLPLMRIRSRLLGDHLVSVPMMNYGGPAGSTAARQVLTAWAFDEANRLGVKSLLLRSRTATPGAFPIVTSKVTVVLPLPTSPDELWNRGFNAKFRNKIKRPQRDGMTTTFGHGQLDAYYEVFAKNMRDLGTPVLPRSFFEKILSTLPDLPLIGATYWNGRPVAGGFGFTWRDEFEMTWSSSVKELRAQKPNMLLYWDYMRELIGQGVRKFNFGRSTPGTGTHEFKQSWGGVDESLPWVQQPESGDDSGPSRAAKAASAIWRHLPLGVTNSLGPTLARQLPWW